MNCNQVLSRYFNFLKCSRTYQHVKAFASILTVVRENPSESALI